MGKCGKRRHHLPPGGHGDPAGHRGDERQLHHLRHRPDHGVQRHLRDGGGTVPADRGCGRGQHGHLRRHPRPLHQRLGAVRYQLRRRRLRRDQRTGAIGCGSADGRLRLLRVLRRRLRRKRHPAGGNVRYSDHSGGHHHRRAYPDLPLLRRGPCADDHLRRGGHSEHGHQLPVGHHQLHLQLRGCGIAAGAGH